MPLIPHIRRDAVTWTALGLVVAAILIVTTHHGQSRQPAAAKASHRSKSTGNLAKQTTQSRARTHNAPLINTPSQLTSRDNPPKSTVVTTPVTVLSTTTTLGLPQTESIDSSGLLSYPNDVSSSYPFQVETGPVDARLTWHSGPSLGLSLSCSGTSLKQHSSLGLIELKTVAISGDCQVNVSRANEDRNDIRYTLSIRYLTSAPSSP